MDKNTPKANIHVLERDEIAPPVKVMPKSLMDAAGLLSDRYADLKRHITKIHGEWSKAN